MAVFIGSFMTAGQGDLDQGESFFGNILAFFRI
jgi:hypothetical protein